MKTIEEKSHNAEKNWKGDPLGFFNIQSVENIKKLKGDPSVKNLLFRKRKSHRAENTLREYPLAPLSFLDDVKILLRK